MPYLHSASIQVTPTPVIGQSVGSISPPLKHFPLNKFQQEKEESEEEGLI